MIDIKWACTRRPTYLKNQNGGLSKLQSSQNMIEWPRSLNEIHLSKGHLLFISDLVENYCDTQLYARWRWQSVQLAQFVWFCFSGEISFKIDLQVLCDGPVEKTKINKLGTFMQNKPSYWAQHVENYCNVCTDKCWTCEQTVCLPLI